MYGGFLILFLLGAAIVAPILWVTWWGVASIASGGGHSVLAPVGPVAPRARSQPHPFPVDLTLLSRPNAITVYNAAGRELAGCPGPDAAGKCSRPLEDGTVPCAGRQLALPRPIRGSFEWQIPSGYRACLLGSYDVFRAGHKGVAQPV